MKDIARELGVSVATVSRALQDNPVIRPDKRRMIQEYAASVNFCPNAIAANLRNSHRLKPRIIGVIIPQLPHYYFSTILSGIEQEASRRGYYIVMATSHELYEREVKICDAFRASGFSGVIVSQAIDTVKYDHFQKLIDANVPLVFYDRICVGLNTDRVVVDDYHGAFTAVEHLIECGCRRIAFYRTKNNIEITKNRCNGYRDALSKHGLPQDESLIINCENRVVAEQITPDILRRPDRPDGFFAVNDDTAVGILYSAKRMGLKVPGDVQICGFTNGVRAISCDPELTTVEQRGVEMGKEAVGILIDKLEGILPMDKIAKKIVKTKLILRETTRCKSLT